MKGPNPQKIRPSAWPYLVCVFLVAVGVKIVVSTASKSVGQAETIENDFQRIVMPGKTTLYLDAGKQTLYVEHMYYRGRQVAGWLGTKLGIKLKSVATGEEIPLEEGHSESYPVAGGRAEGIGTFDIPEAGKYELTGEYPPGGAGPGQLLAVGPALYEPFADFTTIKTGFSVLLFVVALVIFIVTLVKRSKASLLIALGNCVQNPPEMSPPAE